MMLGVALACAGLVRGDDATASTNAAPAPPHTYLQRDWTWVHGAVFVPTNAVNEAQEWDQYDPAVNDRELHEASVYGITCVRVFLHEGIYEKKKDDLLREIDDFLSRAAKYHIKVDFVFFDSCWNNPPEDLTSPNYTYPAPVYGRHNSSWLKGPSDDVLGHYAAHKDELKAYVQDIVTAHKDDSRIALWETYNEPDKGSAQVTQLMSDALGWVHDTGTSIPVTATGGAFKGDAYSDFKSWHCYDAGLWLPPDPASVLCTECMNRQDQSVPGVVRHFKGKEGFMMWEFGIGRDNCRFSWDTLKNPAKSEPLVPFHGLIFPTATRGRSTTCAR